MYACVVRGQGGRVLKKQNADNQIIQLLLFFKYKSKIHFLPLKPMLE